MKWYKYCFIYGRARADDISPSPPCIPHAQLWSISGPDDSGQPNKVVSHPTIPLLVTAHETGDMLLIDERMSKFVGRIQAHSGAVTTVGIHSSGLTLASGGCDGFVRCWDIRQRKLLYENKVGLEIGV